MSTSAPVGKFDFGERNRAAGLRSSTSRCRAHRAPRAAEMRRSSRKAASAVAGLRIPFPDLRTGQREHDPLATGPSLSVATAGSGACRRLRLRISASTSASAEPPFPPLHPVRSAQQRLRLLLSCSAVDPIAALIRPTWTRRAEPVAEEHDDEPMVEAPRAPHDRHADDASAGQSGDQADHCADRLCRARPASAPIPLKPVRLRRERRERPFCDLARRRPQHEAAGEPAAQGAACARARAGADARRIRSDGRDRKPDRRSRAGGADARSGPRPGRAVSVRRRCTSSPKPSVEDADPLPDPPPVVPPLDDAVCAAPQPISRMRATLPPKMRSSPPLPRPGAEVGRHRSRDRRREPVSPAQGQAAALVVRLGRYAASMSAWPSRARCCWPLALGSTGSSIWAAPARAAPTAPQLTADGRRSRRMPKAAATSPLPTPPNRRCWRQMEGASAAPSTEQLVTTDQTAGASPVTPRSSTAGRRTTAKRPRQPQGPHRHRRPDGTIVSGDDGVAGGEALPIEPSERAVGSEHREPPISSAMTARRLRRATDRPHRFRASTARADRRNCA